MDGRTSTWSHLSKGGNSYVGQSTTETFWTTGATPCGSAISTSVRPLSSRCYDLRVAHLARELVLRRAERAVVRRPVQVASPYSGFDSGARTNKSPGSHPKNEHSRAITERLIFHALSFANLTSVLSATPVAETISA